MRYSFLTSCLVATSLTVMGGVLSDAQAQSNGHSLRQIAVGATSSRTVETGQNETAEIILKDGTSIIVAPGSLLSVSVSSDGTVAIQVERGVFRITGGYLNRSQAISMMTPHGILSLKAGAAFVEVNGENTRAHLLSGEELTINSGGRSQRLYRSGFQVLADGSRVSNPRRMRAEAIVADILALSRGLQTGTLPRLQGSQRRAPRSSSRIASVSNGNDDQQPTPVFVEGLPPDVARIDPQVDIGPVMPPVQETPFDLNVDLAGLGGFSPSTGQGATPINVNSTTTTDESFTTVRQGYSDQVTVQSDPFTYEIYLGPTTNRVFPTNNLSTAIANPSDLTALTPGGGSSRSVAYYYAILDPMGQGYNQSPFSSMTSPAGLSPFPDTSSLADSVSGIIRLERLQEGIVNTASWHFNSPGVYDFPFLRADTTFGSFPRDSIDTDFNGIWNQGKGVVVKGLNYGTNFQRGNIGDSIPLVRKDNFMFLDMDVVAAINWLNTNCVSQAACSDSFDKAVKDFVAANPGAISDPTLVRYYDQVIGGFNDPNRRAATGAALIYDPKETRRYIFAAGDLDEVIDNPTPGASVDRYHLSAGMTANIINNGIGNLSPGMHLADGDRAFLRAETWTELADDFIPANFALNTSQLTQSDLMIVNPSGPVIGAVNTTNGSTPKLLYADMGIANDAFGRQVSTISATIGEVRFRYTNELNGGTPAFGNGETVDALIYARTIGSSRGLDSSGASKPSVLMYSDYQSTAAGGGNPNIGNGITPTPGRLGFFVLENTGPIFDDVVFDPNDSSNNGTFPRSNLSGGLEAPIGTSNQQSFAALRLGIATGTQAHTSSRNGFGQNHFGFAAAILDVETSGGVSLGVMGAPDLLSGTYSGPNLRFNNLDLNTNNFNANLNGWQLGGTDGESAFVSDTEFGARSPSGSKHNAAVISGGLVAGELGQNFVETTKDYKHVKWGFFFGDIDNGAQRKHAHMGSFASGNSLSGSDAQRIAAAATNTNAIVQYNGHAIGNVVTGGRNIGTQTGTFTDTFNFGTRKGTATLTLGGRSVTGASSANPGLDRYSSSVSSGGLTGELNGSFIGPATMKPGAGTALGSSVLAPAGVVGGFALSDGLNGGYRAVGTFAGE